MTHGLNNTMKYIRSRKEKGNETSSRSCNIHLFPPKANYLKKPVAEPKMCGRFGAMTSEMAVWFYADKFTIKNVNV